MTVPATAPVRLTVWSDFLCPWCYVGALRIDALHREYGERLSVEWRSFLLQPEPMPKPLDRFRNYTKRWLRPGGPASAAPEAEFRVWLDEQPPSHSLPPAIAGKAALSFGEDCFDRFHLALMHAYFAEHRDVSSRDVVVAVAAEIGIDETAFSDRLRSRGAEFHRAVVDDYADALDRGIAAVPTVLIDGAVPIRGAQDLDVYRQAIERFSASSS
jgi:predicted DsbA family dithiol-disulfide isomerase